MAVDRLFFGHSLYTALWHILSYPVNPQTHKKEWPSCSFFRIERLQEFLCQHESTLRSLPVHPGHPWRFSGSLGPWPVATHGAVSAPRPSPTEESPNVQSPRSHDSWSSDSSADLRRGLHAKDRAATCVVRKATSEH